MLTDIDQTNNEMIHKLELEIQKEKDDKLEQQEMMKKISKNAWNSSKLAQTKEYRSIQSYSGRQLVKASRDLYKVIEEENVGLPNSKLIRFSLGHCDEFLKLLQGNAFDKLLLSSINCLIKVAQQKPNEQILDRPIQR